jgi:hypothetical protein
VEIFMELLLILLVIYLHGEVVSLLNLIVVNVDMLTLSSRKEPRRSMD